MIGATLLVGALIGLAPAHHAAVSYENHHMKGHVQSCQDVSRYRVACEITGTYVVIDGVPAQHYKAMDYVTRSGPCSTHIVSRSSATSGTAHSNGRSKPRDCFTGPIMVIPGPLSLRSSS